VSTESGDGTVTQPEVVAAVQGVADALAGAGHLVEDAVDLPSSDADLVAEMTTKFLTAYPVWVAAELDHFERLTGTAPTASSVEPGTWALAEMGRAVPAAVYAEAVDALWLMRRRICAWFDGPYDLLLTPTVPEVAPKLGQFAATADDPNVGLARSAAIVPFTVPFNISGQPAISVPAAVSPDGLPIGIQLVAGWGHEDRLLQVASQLETIMPWADRRPTIWAG
jgi:amidase